MKKGATTWTTEHKIELKFKRKIPINRIHFDIMFLPENKKRIEMEKRQKEDDDNLK